MAAPLAVLGSALSPVVAGTLDDSACSIMSAPVYQQVNPRTQAALLTTSYSESTGAAKYGFSLNAGIPFLASQRAGSSLTAAYRLYNARSGDFIWVTNTGEITNAVRKYGYVNQGAYFYVAKSPAPCRVPVHRYQRGAMHRFAADAAAGKSLITSGWHDEGVMFWASPTPADQASISLPPIAAPSPSASGSPSASPTSASPSPTPTSPSSTNPPSITARPPSSSAPPAAGGSSFGSGPLSRPLYVATSGTTAWSAYQAATDPATKRALYQIAATPQATWLLGSSGDQSRVAGIEATAAAQGTTPVFVLYAIPYRDCGSYSSGGLASPSAYDAWVNSIRAGIAGRPAVVIVEPDAIGMSCLSASQQADRIGMLKYALSTLSQDPNTWAYLHAGSAGLNPATVAATLRQVGIQNARGFAVNVASYDTTSSEIAYGLSIDQALGAQMHFVIDTSRNGLGRGSTWCNPPGRALGTRPTTSTANPLVDAYLWIKSPGLSDGSCAAGDPPAGQWYQSYALALANQAVSGGIIANYALPAS